MDLTEIGKILREARERKGLSLETVEEHIKVAPSVITALEEGNQEKFPHPVYARGFVRSYAILLGLDHTELCADFAREYPVVEDHDAPASDTGISVRTHAARRMENLLRFTVVLAALGVGVGGWILFDQYRDRVPQDSRSIIIETPPVSDVPARTEEVPISSQLTQMQEVTQSLAGLNQTDDVVPEEEEIVLADESASVANSTTVENSTQPAAAPTERVLVISAHAASWLQARPDDKVVDYFLRKGESASITFSKTLSVKFGNAGGVKLELDGKPYPFQAASGEVKTLVVQ